MSPKTVRNWASVPAWAENTLNKSNEKYVASDRHCMEARYKSAGPKQLNLTIEPLKQMQLVKTRQVAGVAACYSRLSGMHALQQSARAKLHRPHIPGLTRRQQYPTAECYARCRHQIVQWPRRPGPGHRRP